MAVVVKTGVGEFTTHFRTYVSGDWDVLWGYDLDFDPWSYIQKPIFVGVGRAGDQGAQLYPLTHSLARWAQFGL